MPRSVPDTGRRISCPPGARRLNARHPDGGNRESPFPSPRIINEATGSISRAREATRDAIDYFRRHQGKGPTLVVSVADLCRFRRIATVRWLMFLRSRPAPRYIRCWACRHRRRMPARRIATAITANAATLSMWKPLCEIATPVLRLSPGYGAKANYPRDDCSHNGAAAKSGTP